VEISNTTGEWVCITTKLLMGGMVLQLSEFYNNYNPNDRRIKGDSQIITSFGNPVGMQIGQMYKPGGTVALNDRESISLYCCCNFDY
jgi:hypothetical protein